MAKKTGKLTAEEIDYIIANKDRGTCDQIGKALGRRAGVISDYITQNLGAGKEAVSLKIKHHLKDRPFYKDLLKQFSKDEMKTFEDQYVNHFNQFKDDIFHTEEMQILDIIKIGILCDRLLVSQNETRRQIEEIQYEILLEKQKDRVTWDMEFIMARERQISIMQGSMKNVSDEYQGLMTRKSALTKEIKGTRDQRVKMFENRNEKFTTLMTKLTENSEYRRAVGIDMEKYRLAMMAESKRLGSEIRYEDGVVDRPLLNPETVMRDD